MSADDIGQDAEVLRDDWQQDRCNRSAAAANAAATVVHCESVLRGFYRFHLESGTGPMVNPFPLARGRRAGRPNAHHNPMQPLAGERAGRYRPKASRRVPRQIPDERFDELFALLARTGTGRWWRSGCRREHGLRSCWARRPPMPIRDSS